MTGVIITAIICATVCFVATASLAITKVIARAVKDTDTEVIDYGETEQGYRQADQGRNA